VGEVMRLFRHHIGEYALDVEKEIEGVDLTASLSADEKTLFVHAVNTNRLQDKTLEIRMDGKQIKKIKAFTIAEDSMTEITYQNVNVFQPKESETDGNVFVLPASGVSALEIELA
jgi:alpha-L-arabinofuranosidase